MMDRSRKYVVKGWMFHHFEQISIIPFSRIIISSHSIISKQPCKNPIQSQFLYSNQHPSRLFLFQFLLLIPLPIKYSNPLQYLSNDYG